MGLYIRDEETCRLTRKLAVLMGVTITQAVHIAVKERLERLKAKTDSEISAKGKAASENGSNSPPR
jgi:hypothetical protein